MLAAALAALAACSAQPATNAEPAVPLRRTGTSGLDLVRLTIHSRGRSHVFEVEVARDPDQQDRGLMFRRSLGPNSGMLFPYVPPRPASFWMRNTLIPLDMIFIRADGTIARIAVDAEPRSERPIAVGEPVTAVLEIPGGRAAQLGITGADLVSWED
jgi:uncharacterized membrane protein (UPF0127 family)